MKLLAILLLTFSFFSVGCSHYGKKCKKDRMAKHFKMMDADGDGAVSKKEFDTRHKDKWTAMDADKNGKVSMEEMKAYKKAKKKDCKKKKCDKC